MDDARFDDLVRSTAGRTRRLVITGVTVMLAAGLIDSEARSAAAFTCRDGGSTCSKAARCCSGIR